MRKKAQHTSKSLPNNIQTTKMCQVKYMDDTPYSSYSTLGSYYSYGQFYTDVCAMPTSNAFAYCRPKEYRPEKVFYYTKNPEQQSIKAYKEQCPVAKTKMKQKCKVKCQKGHCMKCPDLPVIVEGDSIVEEEETENSKFLGNEEVQCNCSPQSPDSLTDRIVIECEIGSDSSNGSSDSTAVGHDSGYED